MKYVLLPFISWLVAGTCKFLIHMLRFGYAGAKKRIGYGGIPSTHTTILSSVVFLAGFTEGFATPMFSLGMGMLLILIIDAHGLRRKVGEQAQAIQVLYERCQQEAPTLRTRMGHTWGEILCGLLLGVLLAFVAAGV